VTYYGAKSCLNQDLQDALARVDDQNKVSVVSNSYGGPMSAETSGDIAAQEQVVLQGEMQGITFLFSSGDNGDWQPIINWTRTSNIHPNNEMNTLSIEKRNNSIFFYINDKVENVLPFTGAYGNCFGMRVDGSQTVAFDQLIVKGSR